MVKKLTIKIRAYIFTYEREEMLYKVVEHLSLFGIDPVIFDDGSNYETNLPNYNRHEHRGKEGFWRTWDDVLRDAKLHQADLYIFLQDDCMELDVDRVRKIHERFTKAYACQIINDGRKECWVRGTPKKIDDELEQVYFLDCIFFCNRQFLDKMGYRMNPISQERFKNPNISSGVGQQFTFRNTRLNLPIYRPFKSLAFHGDHESKMHPEHRKQTPLISK